MSKTGGRGYRRHGLGWQAEVRVVGHPRSVKQFALDEVDQIRDWRKKEKARLTLDRARAGKGTFLGDARRYLLLVRTMPSYKMRVRDIELWCGVFGTRARSAIDSTDIRLQRDLWRESGPKRVWTRHADRPGAAWVDIPGPLAPSTVNHRLRALANLYTVLDGLHAPNPARQVPELIEDEREDRGLPYDIIEAILDAMPDRRYGRKLTAADADAITARCRGPHVKVALAEEFGVSETMIRKIAKGRATPRSDEASKTKARLRMIAYVGVSHIELTRLKPHTVSASDGWIDTGRRRKGAGVVTGRRPLTPEGLEALQQFIAADAWGSFSRDSMRTSFRLACSKVIAVLGADPAGVEIAAELRRLKMRPYDLRHSYVGAVLEMSGDFQATQLLSGHADLRTTLHYGKKAINPALRATLAKVTAAGGFSRHRIALLTQPVDYKERAD